MKKIIFYGAGEQAIKTFSKKDIIPILSDGVIVCFVDGDKNKHHKEFCGLQILSLTEAKQKFPDAFYYITPLNIHVFEDIQKHLIKADIPIEKILNHIRKTCFYLENFVVCGYHECAFDGNVGVDLGKHSFKSCCSDYGKNAVDSVIINDDLETAFNNFVSMREELLYKIENDIKSCCTGCKYIVETSLPIKNEFEYLIFNELGRCNCKCIYCNFQERLGRDITQDVDFEKLFLLVSEFGFDSSNGIVELCNGEITIHPNKAAYYNVLKDYKIMFLTNGLVFDEEIKRRMLNGTAQINISLDCGTRETFSKIKGIDAYEKVVKNIRNYATNKKGEIYLKYILMPGINTNIDDMMGFLELCKECDVDSMHLSHDLNQKFDLSNKDISLVYNLFIEKAKEYDIKYEVYID